MKRALIWVMISITLGGTPVQSASVQIDQPTKIIQEDNRHMTICKIKKIAKNYVKGNEQGWRYQSPYELLEENDIPVTERNVKLMEKYVKRYFSK